MVARQNGKTEVIVWLTLYLMFMRNGQTVLGVAQTESLAKETWRKAVALARQEGLREEIDGHPRTTNGQIELMLTNGSRYKVSAANEQAGRGLSVDLLFMDELRVKKTWGVWGALAPTTAARPDALVLAASNAGDDESVVLNDMRAKALSGDADSLGLFEWSAEPDVDLDDRLAWAQANPSLGYTLSESVLQGFRIRPVHPASEPSICASGLRPWVTSPFRPTHGRRARTPR